jgi:hypothetical protein
MRNCLKTLHHKRHMLPYLLFTCCTEATLNEKWINVFFLPRQCSRHSFSLVMMLSHNVSQHAGSILTSSQVCGWPLVLEPTMGSWGFFLDCGISKFSFMGQIAFILLSQSSSVCTYIVPVVVVHTAGGCIAVCSANRVVWYNRVVNKVVTVMGFSERALLRLQERNNILIQVICLGCFVLKLFTWCSNQGPEN